MACLISPRTSVKYSVTIQFTLVGLVMMMLIMITVAVMMMMMIHSRPLLNSGPQALGQPQGAGHHQHSINSQFHSCKHAYKHTHTHTHTHFAFRIYASGMDKASG